MTLKSGEQFLHEQNPTFQNSREVKDVVEYLLRAGEHIPNDPAARIRAYLGFLATEVDDGIVTGNLESIDYQADAASIRLSPENADAYVDFQLKIARELGRGGDTHPETLSDGEKMSSLGILHQDQKSQLLEWADELNGAENGYPDWFKYWMFEQVKRHKDYDESPDSQGEPKGFAKRSNRDFSLFPALDRQSVSLVYDALVEKLGGQDMGFEYDHMREFLEDARFGELYGAAQNYGFKITEKLKEIDTGSWHDFTRSENPEDADALASLVRSYRTGWCTAGSETAAKQLKDGDFYVWCSTNPETGEDEVPRIAVRMEDGQVAEVRGVVNGRRQELEPKLVDVVMEKIGDLRGGKAYFQKAEDMKRLTELEETISVNPEVELNDDQLHFLYRVDRSLKGFGYMEDPRIRVLHEARGERDYGELARLLQETLLEQAAVAYGVYREAATRLGAPESMTEKAFGELLERKAAEWRHAGVMEYLVRELVDKDSRPSLVAVPNMIIDHEQLESLGVVFKGSIDDEFFREYGDKNLSGEPSDGPVRFNIIPSKHNMAHGTVEELRKQLAEMQQRNPEMGFREPSMFEAWAYIRMIRERGVPTDSNADSFVPVIRHFGAPHRVDDSYGYSHLYVPYTTGWGGKITVEYENTVDGARLAVGG